MTVSTHVLDTTAGRPAAGVGVSLSYLNAPGGRHVMMVVDPIAVNESKMQLMLTYAKRTDLNPQTATLIKTFDSLQLYEFPGRSHPVN